MCRWNGNIVRQYLVIIHGALPVIGWRDMNWNYCRFTASVNVGFFKADEDTNASVTSGSCSWPDQICLVR